MGDRAVIVAGAGSNETAKSVESVRVAEKVGANAVLAVTPYYNKPPQAGLVAHFLALADASDLPVMVYDIPGRSGIAIARETYLQIAEHERIDLEHGTRWYWRTRGAGENAADVDPVSGSVVLAESGVGAAFAAIAADGRSCRRFSIAEELMVADVATGPDGEIWFVSGMFPEGGDKWDNQLGRLERPDL